MQWRHVLGSRHRHRDTHRRLHRQGRQHDLPASDLQVRRHAADTDERHRDERQRDRHPALEGTPDTTSITVQRASGPGASLKTVYRGIVSFFTDSKLHNGARYRYVLSVIDQAGLVGKVSVTAEPRALTSPLQGQTVRKAPLLRWSPVAGADYYNVQLFLAGHKVLSTWPIGTTLKLATRWTYRGHTYTFGKGRYRWYVWPGYGPRKAARYGRLLGASVFVAA